MKIIVTKTSSPIVQDIYSYIKKVFNAELIVWDKLSRPFFALLKMVPDPDFIFFTSSVCSIDTSYKFVKNDFNGKSILLNIDNAELDKKYFDKVVDVAMLPRRANIEMYGGGTPSNRFKTDVLLITDYVDTANIGFIEKMKQLATHYRVKAFGENRLEIPEYLGKVSIYDYKNMLASAKVLLSYDNYWDENAKIYGLTIATSHIDSKELLVNKIAGTYSAPLDYEDLVREIMKCN